MQIQSKVNGLVLTATQQTAEVTRLGNGKFAEVKAPKGKTTRKAAVPKPQPKMPKEEKVVEEL